MDPNSSNYIKIIKKPNNPTPKKQRARKSLPKKSKTAAPNSAVNWWQCFRQCWMQPFTNCIPLKHGRCIVPIVRMKISSAGRSLQPVSKVNEVCQFTVCAMSEMTQSPYSLHFGKSSCGLPGNTTAAATAAIRLGERHLHGCQVCRAPLCQNSQDSAQFRVPAVALPKLAFWTDLGGKVSFWENGSFCFLKRQMGFKLLEFTCH